MLCFINNISGATWTDATQTARHNTALKGQAYLDNQPIDHRALASHLDNASSPDQITVLLQRLNGFYAWVSQTPTELRAGVDHIRSRPLFYGQKDGRFYLSDEAEWLRQQIGETEMDPLAREEFQLAGYVTGGDTLFPNIKQLQAGEYLIARVIAEEIFVETHRYYRFLHIEPSVSDELALGVELDLVALSSVQRLIDYAAGRQVVVPLSGGYDSRLLVTLLKRLGYDKVITFTYGVPGNKESEYSKRVADSLGLDWHFVEYSEERWRDAWQTSESWTYQKWASNWSSLAHNQDWLAVKMLKDNGLVEQDCLFVPGHCCVTGLIPNFVFGKNRFSRKEYLESLKLEHYSLAPLKYFPEIRSIGTDRFLKHYCPDKEIFDQHEFVRSFMLFGWEERQAKYICNSLRAYEFFSYDWWMPLWDLEFARFWQKVPLKLRKDRKFYRDYVMKQFDSVSESASRQNLANAAAHSEGVTNLRNILEKFRLIRLSRKIKFLAIKFKLLKNIPLKNQSYFLLSDPTLDIVSELEKKQFSVIGAYAWISMIKLSKDLSTKI